MLVSFEKPTSIRFLLILIPLFLFGCGSLVYHKVEPGDTLYSIGWRYDQDFRDIAKWNRLSPPYVIQEGQWLRVAPPADEEWWVDEYPQRAKALTTPSVNTNNVAVIKKRVPQKGIQQKKESQLPVVEIAQWQWPTSIKGKQNITRNNNLQKKGINIYGEMKQPIVAAADGKVVYSGNGLVGYGNIVIVKHNKNYLSAYGHNNELLVKEGDQVKKGQKIALMGNAPDGVTALYFELRRNGRPVNPLKYLPTVP